MAATWETALAVAMTETPVRRMGSGPAILMEARPKQPRKPPLLTPAEGTHKTHPCLYAFGVSEGCVSLRNVACLLRLTFDLACLAWAGTALVIVT